MSYKSPIDLIYGEMNSKIEDGIYQAIQNVGIYVDKEELIKAIKYDRAQYEKGYKDRDSEIVRCKDCKHRGRCEIAYGCVADHDWFCADGKRK